MSAFLLTALHAAEPYGNEILTALAVGFVAFAAPFALGPVFHRYGREA